MNTPGADATTDRRRARPGGSPARAWIALGLAALVPALTLDLDGTRGPVLEPLAHASRTSWVLGVLLLVATAPRARPATSAVPAVALVCAPFLALAVALDGGLARAAAGLAVAALGERAALRGGPGWTAGWWLLFAGPVLAAGVFGWGSGRPELAQALASCSPLALALGPAWIGAALGAAAGLVGAFGRGGAGRGGAGRGVRRAAGAALLIALLAPNAPAQGQRLFGARVQVQAGVERLELRGPRGGVTRVDLTGFGSRRVDPGGFDSGANDVLELPIALGDAVDLDFAPARVEVLAPAPVRGPDPRAQVLAYLPPPRLPAALRGLSALPAPVGRSARAPVPWPAFLLALAGSIAAAVLARSGGRSGALAALAAAALGAVLAAAAARAAGAEPGAITSYDVAAAPGGGRLALEVTWTRGTLELGPAASAVQRLGVVTTEPVAAELVVEVDRDGARVRGRGDDGAAAGAAAAAGRDAVAFTRRVPRASVPEPAADLRRWWRAADGRWWERGTGGAWRPDRAPPAGWAAAGWPPAASALVVASDDGRTWWRELGAPRPAGVPAP